MTPRPPLAAIAVGIIAVLGIGVLLLRAAGAPIALGPETPTPSPTQRPSPAPTAEPTKGASPSQDVAATFDQIEREVEALRGLPAAEIGPPEVIGRQQLLVELRQAFDEDYPVEEREADNITLRAMGLLGDDEDVAELQLQLLGDQVLGFYDDTEKRMVVVSDAGVDASARFTYAHEYAHALQDAAFGLEALEEQTNQEDDRDLALTSLVEGDATLSMFVWALQGGLTPQELLEIEEQPLPDMSGIPDWMVATLEFPYAAGFEWTLQVAGDPFNADFGAIDDAFADVPTSTEQVLHFEKWDPREEPIVIEAPDLAGALGANWRQVESTAIGEAFIAFVLEHFGVGPAVAAEAAAGG